MRRRANGDAVYFTLVWLSSGRPLPSIYSDLPYNVREGLESGIQGVKWRQHVCNVLIVEGTSGLQSRLRRFDSDPSLDEIFQEPE